MVDFVMREKNYEASEVFETCRPWARTLSLFCFLSVTCVGKGPLSRLATAQGEE